MRAAGLGGDIDGGAFEFGGFHLARDRAIPDQLVQTRLIAVDIFGDLGRRAAGAGRAYRFVRFLRVLRLVVIFARARRHVFLAVILAEHGADIGDRFRREVDAVGAHIGDEAGGLAVDLDAFVETLRQPHGDRRRKAELAARLLLHGRGGEGRRRIAPRGLGLDRGNGEGRAFKRILQVRRLNAGADVEALKFLSVGADQAGFEAVAARRRQFGDDRPIFLGDEFLDFQLAVAHQPQCDRLHAAGRACARQFAPEHRREREADQIIQRAARQIGIDQRIVDGARMLHGLGHRLFGDGVEDDALDRLAFQRLLFVKRFQHVPGNRLAFAVRVGGQNRGCRRP